MNTMRQVKEIPILDVAKLLGIEVKRNKAMCFSGHDRKSPSLKFTPSKNLFYCFGCDVGGSNIDLVMNVNGLAFKAAMEWLNLNFITSSFSGQIKNKKANQFNQNFTRQVMLNPNPDIYGALFKELRLSDVARDYLNKRGFQDATIDQFCIKDISDCKSVFNKMIELHGMVALKSCGLVRQVEYQKKVFENFIWWDQTILFPFFDQNKQVIYIQGRRLDVNGPKYIGLKEITKPLYNSSIINSLRKRSLLLICEGIPDVLAANEMGCQAVGVLGAYSFKEQWVDELLQYDIVVVPDNDSAGGGFAKRIKEAFLKKGKIIQIVRIEEVKDLSEYYQRKGLKKE